MAMVEALVAVIVVAVVIEGEVVTAIKTAHVITNLKWTTSTSVQARYNCYRTFL